MIGCPLSSDTEPWHSAQPIPLLTSRIDINYLTALVENGHQPVRTTCTYVGHTNERKPKCGMYIHNLHLTYAYPI